MIDQKGVRFLIAKKLRQKGINCNIPVTRQTLYNFIKLGLPYIQRGKKKMFVILDVLRWLKNYKE
jgi:hypothetical protein